MKNKTIRVLAAFSFIANSAIAEVVDQDTRVPTQTDSVGMIVCHKKVGGEVKVNFSNGTLVEGNRTVLAAGHLYVLEDYDDYSNLATRVIFDYKENCEYRRYKRFPKKDTQRQDFIVFRSSFSDAYFHTTIEEWDATRDLAVLTLEKKDTKGIPLKTKSLKVHNFKPETRLPVEIVAYHGDRLAGTSRQAYRSTGFVYLGTDRRGVPALAHSADTATGASGAAIQYTMSNNVNVVIGVHSAALLGMNQNEMVPLTNDLIRLIRNMARKAN